MKARTSVFVASTLLALLVGGSLLSNLADGQTTPTGITLIGPAGLTGPSTTVNVHGIPRPDQMMWLKEGTLYTVPTGKIFVCTGLGYFGITSGTTLGVQINSIEVLRIQAKETVTPIPPGLVATAGQTIECWESPGAGQFGILMGYLADA